MKKVKLSFDWWDALVEIDRTPETLEIMKSQLLFWSRGQQRIDAENGDIETAYLKMLAQEMITLSAEYSTEGIKQVIAEKEGWGSLDGKYGVKLICTIPWNFLPSEISVIEIP